MAEPGRVVVIRVLRLQAVAFSAIAVIYATLWGLLARTIDEPWALAVSALTCAAISLASFRDIRRMRHNG